MKTFSYTLANQWFADIHMKWWSFEYFKLGMTKFLEYYVISKVCCGYIVVVEGSSFSKMKRV